MNTQHSMAALAAMAGSARIFNGPSPFAADPDELRETVQALGMQLKATNNQIKSITGRAEAASRDLTAGETEKVDSLFAKFNAIDAELRIAKTELEDAEREVTNSVPQPRKTGANAAATATSRGRIARLDGFAAPARNYAGMFPAAQQRDPYGGAFETLGDFALAVASGHDGRLLRNAVEGSPSTIGEGVSAGFMVPPAFVQKMLDAALQLEVFRPRAQVVPITAGNSLISGFKTTDQTGAKRAGLQLMWDGEGERLAQQKPIAQEMTVRATKANVFCAVSSELLNDATNFDQQLSQGMTAAVAAGLDQAFINGTGVGQPLGIIHAPCTITVSKESGQAANTLLLQNIAKMCGRLSAASFSRSVWYVHPTLVPQLYLMSFTILNVAGTERVGGSVAPAVSHDAAGNLSIFGRPAIVTDACSALSSKGDIVLCDPLKYIIAMRQDVRLVKDTSVYFDSDQIAFRLTMRLDGMPEDGEVTTLRDGSSTVSPFVVLEAR